MKPHWVRLPELPDYDQAYLAAELLRQVGHSWRDPAGNEAEEIDAMSYLSGIVAEMCEGIISEMQARGLPVGAVAQLASVLADELGRLLEEA